MRVGVADDVETARVAGVDVDPDVEPEMAHELLEDLPPGGERLGRRLGGLQIGPLGRDRSACSGDLGGFVGR